MAEYQLSTFDVVVRTADQVFIPNDPANLDRMEYEAWLADGGVPDPYVEPSPSPAPETTVLYDHENRLRAIEGTPPLALGDFVDKMKGKSNAV